MVTLCAQLWLANHLSLMLTCVWGIQCQVALKRSPPNMGLEPTTTRLKVERSSNWANSVRRTFLIVIYKTIKVCMQPIATYTRSIQCEFELCGSPPNMGLQPTKTLQMWLANHLSLMMIYILSVSNWVPRDLFWGCFWVPHQDFGV